MNMTSTIQNVSKKANGKRWAIGLLATVLGISAIGAAPAPAQAGGIDWDFNIHIDLGSRRHPEHRRERVWVPPIYRTVQERVWVPPVVETVHEQVWVPERVEQREVVRYDRYGRRYVTCETIVVPGHYETVTRQVETCPGRWEIVERQVLVREGHWEYVDRYDVPHRPLPPTVPPHHGHGDRHDRWDRDDHLRRGRR
jgi:hypothetical protein